MAAGARTQGAMHLPSIGADVAGLWALVGLELLTLVLLRSGFRRHHGG